MFSTNLCDKVSKIKNLICIFSSFFHAAFKKIIFVCHIQPYMAKKIADKMGNFQISHKFIIIENVSTCFANICAMKFQKSKACNVHFFHFSMLIPMRYFLLAISKCCWWKNGQENWQFSYFS